MSIIRLQEMTPQIYTEESRDFQLLTRLYDSVFNGMKFDTDSITSLINTKECRTNILQLLQTKLGFFTERKLDDEKLRSILECFPILVRNKGSLKAIKEALYLFLRMYSVSSDMEIYYLKTPFSEPFSEEEPCVLANGKYPENNSLIIRIHSFQTKPDISVLEELFRYILPAGINYYIEFDKKGKLSDIVLSSEDSAELLFVSDNINSEIRNSGQIFTTDDTDSETSKIAYKLGAVNTISLISTDSYVSNRFIGYYTSEEDANDYLETLTDKLYSTAIINYDPVETKTGSIVSFLPDPSVTKLDDLTVNIEPVQDLHGYDSPWPGGGGKNKLQVTATTQTINGVTFTVNSDGSVNVNGTATANAILVLNSYDFDGTAAILSGCPSGGSGSTFKLDAFGASGLSDDIGSGVTISTSGTRNVRIVVFSGTTITNKLFKPMIRLASVTDATFAPYSNICPISGWDSVKIKRTGNSDNLLQFDNFSRTDGVTVTAKNGAIIVNGTTASAKTFSIPLKNTVNMHPDGHFVAFNNLTASTGIVVYFRRGTTNIHNWSLYIADRTGEGWTATANEDIDALAVQVIAGTYDNYIFQPMLLEKGKQPFNTYTIQLGETVYGCTLDAVGGKMVVDRAMVDMGSVNWFKNTVTQGTLWRHTFDDMANAVSTIKAHILCSLYLTVPQTQRSEKTLSANSKNVDVIDSSYADAASFKTAVTGQTIVYQLSTPFEIPLTPVQIATLQGTNDVWSDAGDVTITYRRDFTCVPMICTSYTNNTPTWRRINFLGNLTLEDVSTEGGIVAALEARGITVNDGDLILYNNIYLLRVNGSWQECNYARYIMNTYNITE